MNNLEIWTHLIDNIIYAIIDTDVFQKNVNFIKSISKENISENFEKIYLKNKNDIQNLILKPSELICESDGEYFFELYYTIYQKYEKVFPFFPSINDFDNFLKMECIMHNTFQKRYNIDRIKKLEKYIMKDISKIVITYIS